MFDSGIGIPIGQKIQLKTLIQVDNPAGGKFKMYYKMQHFNENEVFRIGVNGITLALDRGSTAIDQSFKEFESETIEKGTHSLDIAVLSDF